MGHVFTVPWAIAPSGEWRSSRVYATTEAADSSPRTVRRCSRSGTPTGPPGAECGGRGDGLTEASLAACDVVEIPMHGEVPSVNVAAAAAICLYERMRSVRT